MPWYASFAVSTGLNYLSFYIMRSKMSAERKAAWSQLVVSINTFLIELGASPMAVPPAPGA